MAARSLLGCVTYAVQAGGSHTAREVHSLVHASEKARHVLARYLPPRYKYYVSREPARRKRTDLSTVCSPRCPLYPCSFRCSLTVSAQLSLPMDGYICRSRTDRLWSVGCCSISDVCCLRPSILRRFDLVTGFVLCTPFGFYFRRACIFLAARLSRTQR